MKKALLLVFSITFGFISMSWTLDQNAARLITVSGDAEVKVSPDEVVIIVGVETSNMILKEAKNKNDKAVRGIINVVKKYDIDLKNVQTDYFTIEPKYENRVENNIDKMVFMGFYVRKNIVITLKDLSKYEDVLSGVLEAGANYIRGIKFLTTELRKFRDQAREMAINAAKEKAELFASQLNMKIGKTYSITEDYGGWYSWNNSWGQTGQMQNASINAGNYSPPEGSTISPGEISVTARVTVSFELE